MLTIFDQDEYTHYFPTQNDLKEIIKEVDRLSPVQGYSEIFKPKDVRASERALYDVFGTRDEKGLQVALQPYSDGIKDDINKNLERLKKIYLGIGEGFYLMDRLDLYKLQGASTLSGVYEYFASRGLPPPFEIGQSQAGKFRQIYWTGYRLQLSGKLDDEGRQRIFEAFADFDNKDKIYHAATLMTPQNYGQWIDYATDENVSLRDVQSVTKGGRELLKSDGNRNKITPNFIIAASKQVDTFALPKSLHISNIHDPQTVVKRITESTTIENVRKIRDGLTAWLKD